jgi:hypothetical protein
MKRSLAARMLALAAGTLALVGSAPVQTRGSGKDVLYFFTTPEVEGGPEGAHRAKDFIRKHAELVSLRPVLLAKDFRVLKAVTEKSPLARTLKELEAGSKPGSLDIPLYDEEGLRLAQDWELRSVPAFVLVRAGRAHILSGTASNLDLLWECTR